MLLPRAFLTCVHVSVALQILKHWREVKNYFADQFPEVRSCEVVRFPKIVRPKNTVQAGFKLQTSHTAITTLDRLAVPVPQSLLNMRDFVFKNKIFCFS